MKIIFLPFRTPRCQSRREPKNGTNVISLVWQICIYIKYCWCDVGSSGANIIKCTWLTMASCSSSSPDSVKRSSNVSFIISSVIPIWQTITFYFYDKKQSQRTDCKWHKTDWTVLTLTFNVILITKVDIFTFIFAASKSCIFFATWYNDICEHGKSCQ